MTHPEDFLSRSADGPEPPECYPAAPPPCPYCRGRVVIDRTAHQGIRAADGETGCEFCNPLPWPPAE